MSNNIKKANPTPLGFLALSLTTFLLSLINSGLFGGNNLGLVFSISFVFGGAIMVIAGILEYKNGNTLETTSFIAYGAFWFSFALFMTVFANDFDAKFLAWSLVFWGSFSMVMFIASLKRSRILQIVYLGMSITFYLLGLSDIAGNIIFTGLGGYTGIITALFAFYLAAIQIINEAKDCSA